MVLDAIRRRGEHEVVGLLHPEGPGSGRVLHGVPVIGIDAELAALRERGIAGFFMGVGSLGDAGKRRRLFELGSNRGLAPVRVVHPAAIFSESASLGPGSVVLAGAIVNPDAHIGANVIINTGSIIEHGCVVEDHVHIATGAHLGGDVLVEEGAHVGLGATVLQGISVGRNAVIGAGAVAVRDVPSETLVVGVPAAPIERSSGKRAILDDAVEG